MGYYTVCKGNQNQHQKARQLERQSVFENQRDLNLNDDLRRILIGWSYQRYFKCLADRYELTISE